MKIIRCTTAAQSIVFFEPTTDYLKNIGYDQVMLSSPGPTLNEFGEKHNVRTIAVAMERHISPFKDLKSLFGLIKVFRRERPTMVHSMTPKAGLLCMMAAWVCRVPVRLHTFTGLVFPTAVGLTKKILIFTDRLTCACATHIIPEGEGVKNDLLSYKITKKPLKVLGYGNVRGIDLKHFNPESPEVQAEALKIRKPDVFTFIFIGRLVRDKGINELVKAFTRLNSLYPNTRLLLVGPYEENLDPLAHETLAEIKSNKAIEAVGAQKDVRPWLAASDAFVFPSYREGFPNVVIEAGAMGLPAVVTDINGSREIIIENENGTIIPSHDAKKLYQAMETMLNNASQRLSMASKSRQLIVSRFEQGFVRQCLIDYYKEILNLK